MRGNLLIGNKVRLRAIEPADLEFIYSIENDPVIWRVGNTLTPYSRHQLEQYILSSQHDVYSEKQIRLMIDTLLPENEKKTIGVIDLYEFDPHHGRAGVGIFVLQEEQEKGYATDALQVMIRYCFEILNLHMLHCNISADNSNSIRLFEKAGFQQCGLRKDWRHLDNGWMDELMFQLIRP
ncbi:MAG: GNAT family N-acetyltransferase [Bacteroidetes bacterium]|nr:GNAT family N-acetyltransferase [Bacteroidota bacterium]